MGYIDKYKIYLQEIPADINFCERSGRYPVFGYTSNLDIVIKWNSNTFNQLIEKYLKEEPSLKASDSIRSMADFTRIVSFYAINGLGGEIDISDIEVCKQLENLFDTEYALGGTGAQSTAALAAMGFPVISHITDRSREVCKFLSSERISLVSNNGLSAVSQAAANEPPVCHMVLQYPKNDIVKIGGSSYTIPTSNRLIMDYDRVHKFLHIDDCFLKYCENNAKSITSYNISGFNSIVDMIFLKKTMVDLCAHYSRVKAINPSCVIYLESAHYLNPEANDYVFKETALFADIIGMNEEELVNATARLHRKTDIYDLNSIISSLDLIKRVYRIAGIVMHTKDYSLYYGDVIGSFNIEKGLTLGNLMSATRARTGRYGFYKDCGESLSLDLSPAGLKFAAQLENINLEHRCYLVPSRYMEKPKYTIGLGDTFSAGVQISFIN